MENEKAFGLHFIELQSLPFHYMRTLTNQRHIFFTAVQGCNIFFYNLLSLAFQDAFETTTPKSLFVTIFWSAVQHFPKDLLNAIIFLLYRLVRDLISYPADLKFLKFTEILKKIHLSQNAIRRGPKLTYIFLNIWHKASTKEKK